MTKTPAERPVGQARGRTARGSHRARGRQEEVLEVAAKIFYEKGYEAASVQDIADALGILKGSVYYYIKSKEDLLFALLFDVHKAELDRLKDVLAMDANPVAKLRELLRQHVLANLENRITSAVFFHDFRSLSKAHREEIIKERDRVERTTRQLIQAGQAEGYFIATADPKIMSLGILGMTNSFYTWYVQSGKSSESEIANQFADFTIRGLAAPGVDLAELLAAPDGAVKVVTRSPVAGAAKRSAQARRSRR